MEIRKILYATDLSACSRQAFAPATSLARRFDAELHVFHAVVFPGNTPADFMAYAPVPEESYAAATAAAEQKLSALAKSSSASGTRLVIAQGLSYRAAEAILDYADRLGIDLIVMGTHGRNGAGRLLLGSVAEEVMRRAACPVFVMRQLEDGKDRPTGLVRHIVVPVDFSLPAREALVAAGEVAHRYGARVTLLHVIDEPAWLDAYPESGAAKGSVPRERVTARAERRLHGAAALLPPGVPCEIELRGGQPAVEIAAFVARTGADLVVMASRGLSGIERLVFGSTAEAVLRTVDAPVMVVHPARQAQEGALAATKMEPHRASAATPAR